MAGPESHALLGASSAYRWLNCTPSVMLSRDAPASTSDYAEAGTLAHEIAELKARNYFVEPMGPEAFTAALEKLTASEYYAREMDDATDEYLEALVSVSMEFESPPFVALEQRVGFEDVVPGGFGTADAIMIHGDTIVIADYKNGAGVPVEAEENPQLMLYAWGALRKYRLLFGHLHRAILLIVQPHAGGVKRWETTANALQDWAYYTVSPRASDAAEGKGEAKPGDWCRFCPVKARCRARAEMMLETGKKAGTDPRLLSLEEIGGLLPKIALLKAWAKDLEELAYSAALRGDAVPGFKLVEGRKSREWAGGTDAAFAKIIERGTPEAMLWERKPVTVAALEKAMGKKAFSELADLVTTKPGKPALVPESDKRQAYEPAKAAFKPIEDEAMIPLF